MARTNETLGELQPNERNPRRMSEVQREALRKSLAEFGPLDGFIFNRRSKSLVGGHQRKSILANESRIVIVERLQKPNAQGTIARGYVEANGERITYREVDWKPAKEKAGMIAANKHSGEWNETELAKILADLETEDFDLDLTGFDEAEIGDLLEKSEVDAEPQIDKAAKLAAKWKVERGQIWELGNHRLMCGDSTNNDNLAALLNGDRGHAACITDPPYGIDWNTDYTRFTSGKRHTKVNYKPIAGDQQPFNPEPWLGFEKVVMWGGNLFADKLPLGSWIIWDKREQSGTAWLADAEIAWMKGGYGVYICPHTGPIREGRGSHPTQKRTDVVTWTIQKCGATESIFDPFLGSGTTLIACEQLGRKCRAMEIDPGYVGVAIQRWVDATGKTPVKGDGPP